MNVVGSGQLGVVSYTQERMRRATLSITENSQGGLLLDPAMVYKLLGEVIVSCMTLLDKIQNVWGSIIGVFSCPFLV